MLYNFPNIIRSALSSDVSSLDHEKVTTSNQPWWQKLTLDDSLDANLICYLPLRSGFTKKPMKLMLQNPLLAQAPSVALEEDFVSTWSF